MPYSRHIASPRTIVSRAAHVTKGVLLAVPEAVVGLVETGMPGAGLLPDVEDLRATVGVANQAAQDGVAELLNDPIEAVQAAMWQALTPPSCSKVAGTAIWSESGRDVHQLVARLPAASSGAADICRVLIGSRALRSASPRYLAVTATDVGAGHTPR